MNNSNSNSTINLFWSGGWDSTFRLLQLLIIFKKKVQPYYIIDEERKSILEEIQAMYQIKIMLVRMFPETRDLLRPTIYKELFEIKQIDAFRESLEEVQKQIKIGDQYEWLPRFCYNEGIKDMEVGLELLTYRNEDNKVLNLIKENLIKYDNGYGAYYRLDKNVNKKELQNLFGNLNYSLFDLTKIEMMNIAHKHGFFGIMKRTWFCLAPTSFSNPCGKCGSCRTVYNEGLQWRIPLVAKIRYFIWPTLRKNCSCALF